MPKNIALIGMVGCGKSTIGKLLCQKISGFSFVDIDEIIENFENAPIFEIFEKFGENYFRNLENKVLKSVIQNSNLVISTGGGIILLEENRTLLQETCCIVYLKSDLEKIYKRISNDSSRPILKNCKNFKNFELIFNKRKDFYEKIADFTIKTGSKSPQNIVEEIMLKLG